MDRLEFDLATPYKSVSDNKSDMQLTIQTVKTQIRLLLNSLIRVYTICHSADTFWTHYQIEESHFFKFKNIDNIYIRAVSPEPLLLAHTSSESRGTFRQNARSLAPLNDWACAVKICHDGMLEDTNLLDAAQFKVSQLLEFLQYMYFIYEPRHEKMCFREFAT